MRRLGCRPLAELGRRVQCGGRRGGAGMARLYMSEKSNSQSTSGK